MNDGRSKGGCPKVRAMCRTAVLGSYWVVTIMTKVYRPVQPINTRTIFRNY
jgi:hypothetical protein